MSLIVDISEVLLVLGLSESVTEEERAIVQASIVSASGAVQRHLKYDPVQKVHTEFYPSMDFSLRSRNAVWEVDNNQAFQRRIAEAASDELQVQHIPVRETDEDGNNPIEVRIDFDARSGTKTNAFANETIKVQGTDYWPNYDTVDSNSISVCRDGIIRSFGRWPSVAGSVKIVYVAGYTRTELHGQDSVIDASPIMDSVVDEAVRRVQKAYSRRKKSGVGFTGPFESERLGDYSYKLNTKTMETLIGGNWDLLPETIMKLNDFIHYGVGAM